MHCCPSLRSLWLCEHEGPGASWDSPPCWPSRTAPTPAHLPLHSAVHTHVRVSWSLTSCVSTVGLELVFKGFLWVMVPRAVSHCSPLNFLFSNSTKDSLRSNSPVEMETSTEPMDPLTPSVAALAVQPEGGSGWRTALPVGVCSGAGGLPSQRVFGPGPADCFPGGCSLWNVTLSSLDVESCLCPQSSFLKKFQGFKGPRKMWVWYPQGFGWKAVVCLFQNHSMLILEGVRYLSCHSVPSGQDRTGKETGPERMMS